MNDLRVINLSSYTTPKVTEQKNRNWIGYGEDNNYFKYLIDRYNGSPTNNAIINAVSAMIYGKGLDATDSNKKPEQYAKMVSLFNKDCTRKLCYDLKLMGQCSMQVIYSKDRKTIAQIEHFPIETLRAEKPNDDGDIEAYYYFSDWSKYKQNSKLKRIPAFGMSNESIEIFYVKPYRAGYFFYSPVDYQGGLQYAELEEEVGNFHLNNIMNGMSPSMLINFNNGTPTEEERERIEHRIMQKFSGSSNAGKFILAFNDNADTQASIDPVQLSDAHQQYQFLSEESTRKIMVSHRIVSPMLIGIKDQSGLGNNADELKTASILLDNTVIRPFQHLLIDAFDQILAYNKISLNLYFKTLQPLEFTDLTNVEDEETKEEETGVKLSKEIVNKNLQEFIELGDNEHDILKNYDLIDQFDVDYETEDELDLKIKELNEKTELVSTGRANKTKDSEQDGKSKKKGLEDTIFLVRYMYTPYSAAYKTRAGRSREFCIQMMRASKVYRKEDIMAMSNKAVNPDFAGKGKTTYSVWLFKGGARCSHRWTRKIYARKEGSKSMGDTISTTASIKKGFRPEKNANKVSIAPRNMPNKGYTAAYWNKMGFKN